MNTLILLLLLASNTTCETKVEISQHGRLVYRTALESFGHRKTVVDISSRDPVDIHVESRSCGFAYDYTSLPLRNKIDFEIGDALYKVTQR